MLNKIIKQAEDIPLSTTDLLNICNNQTKVVLYHELEEVDDILQLFQPYNSFILLYEFATSNIGHFVSVIYYPERNEIHHYDSYALLPDVELDLTHTQGRKYLSELYDKARESGINITINQTRHQLFKENVNTCGRHSALRIIFRHLTAPQYNNFINGNASLKNPDEICTAFTITSSLQNYI